MTTMFFAEGGKLVQLGESLIGLMHDVAGSSPCRGSQQKEQVRNRVPVLFVYFRLFGLDHQDIMIRDVYRSLAMRVFSPQGKLAI